MSDTLIALQDRDRTLLQRSIKMALHRRRTVVAIWLTGLAGLLVSPHRSTAQVSSQPEVVRVVVAGDSRANPGFAEVLRAAREATKERPPVALITPGDMDPFTTTEQQIVAVFGEPTPGSAEAAKHLVWYPVVGNHEATTGPETMQDFRAFYEKKLAHITNAGPLGTRETTYSFDLGPLHVAVINEYWNGEAQPGSDIAIRDAVVPALRTWLAQDLKASTSPFKIVVGHEPAFPQSDQDFHEGRHAGSSLDARVDERDAFWKVLEEQRVALLVCGHTHRYSRYRPPGSLVWQIDAAQARSDVSWKYDAFVILTATAQTLNLETYRHLQDQAKWQLTDTMTLRPDRTVVAAAATAAPAVK